MSLRVKHEIMGGRSTRMSVNDYAIGKKPTSLDSPVLT